MQLLVSVFSILNLLSWYACIYVVAQKFEFANSLCLGIACINLAISYYVFARDYPLTQRTRPLFALALGLSFDQVALTLGLIQLNGKTLLPLWLVGIWLNFIAASPLYLSLFKNHPKFALMFGGFAGPLSYYAGQQFGIIYFTHPVALLIYALFWALYFYWLTRPTAPLTN